MTDKLTDEKVVQELSNKYFNKPFMTVAEVVREAYDVGRRDGLEEERGYLISCPWCGEKMEKRPVSHQISHLIDHGDRLASISSSANSVEGE